MKSPRTNAEWWMIHRAIDLVRIYAEQEPSIVATGCNADRAFDTFMQFIDLKTQQAAIRTELDKAISGVLDHGQYIMGPEVAQLEHKLAERVDVKHCVTVASGTEALLISLMSLDIGPGDEVITTPFTFIATVEMIVLLGAKPIFVDVEFSTGNIDASKIEQKISDKTKAIIPVSLYGQCADMAEINRIAAHHGNIPVIEDGAQSFGATYNDTASCGLSTIGLTSFFPSKPLGCYGDGGALFTDDEALATAAREIRVHGQSRRYHHTRVGVGGRMDTLQCAVLLAKLPRFDWEVTQRQHLGHSYTQRLLAEVPHAKEVSANDTAQPLDGVRTLQVHPSRSSVYAQYTVLVPNRGSVQDRLKQQGIPTVVHYPTPLNRQPAYQDLCCPDCTPIADWMSAHVLSLPMSPDLPEEQLSEVVSKLASLY